MKDPALTFLVRVGFQKTPLTIVGVLFEICSFHC